MKIVVAAVQMPSDLLDVSANLHRADDLLRSAHDSGVELAVLPELFNTGYSLCPDFGPYSETAEGPTLAHLRQRSRQWRMAIAAGFVEREGRHLYDSLVFCSPDGDRPDLSQAQPRVLGAVSIPPRPIAAGRRDAVGTGRLRHLRRHDLSQGLERLSRAGSTWPSLSAAWPDFADRDSGRRHWLLGHVGPLSGAIPAKVAMDLGIPVIFANQCGETRTTIPVLGTQIKDRFAGQSSICDGRHGEPVRADRSLRLTHRPHHPPPSARYEIVAFYVPLGPRGLLFRIGTFVIGIWGGLVYGRAYRRRASSW